MSTKVRVAGILLFLLALTGLILLVARPGLNPARIQPLALVAGAWIAFGCAALLLRGVTVKLAIGLILAGGIAVQAAALSAPPQNSSDLYRYIWDGRVQAAGIDPYAYPPADAGIASLRNDFLWSGTGPGNYGDCFKATKSRVSPADNRVAGCTKINRPKMPTVYPPVAEAYFLGVQLAAPADNSTTPIQAAAALCAILTTLILLFGLRMLGKDPRLAALWAWCPTVALEAGQNAHVDVVAVMITAVALLMLARARTAGRTAIGGVLLGLAIATKVTPVLVLPAVLRRGWFLISAAAAAAISLVYAPHVLAVGRKVIGFLPGYMKQEGYSTGTGFDVIGLVVPQKLTMAVAVVILGVIALAILRFSDPDQPWRGSVLMTAAALAICTPHFQWYAILLVMLVAFDGRPEWLAIAAGGYLANNHNLFIAGFSLHDPRAAGYGIGAAIACAGALARYILDRRAAGVPAVPAVPAMAGGGDRTATVGVAASDAGSAADAALAPVIEPTAVYNKSTVSVTIGADGAPAFDADGADAHADADA
jgi:hypothetical protein